MLAETVAIRSAFMHINAQSLRSIANSIRYVTVVACIPNLVVGNGWRLTLYCRLSCMFVACLWVLLWVRLEVATRISRLCASLDCRFTRLTDFYFV